MAGVVTKLTAQTFDEAVASAETPVLVLFCAEGALWCERELGFLESAASDIGNSLTLFTFDVNEAPDLAHQHDVTSIPTFVVFREGTEVKRFRWAGNRTHLIKSRLGEFLPAKVRNMPWPDSPYSDNPKAREEFRGYMASYERQRRAIEGRGGSEEALERLEREKDDRFVGMIRRYDREFDGYFWEEDGWD